MKKYVRPELFYESFELSHNVANCGYTGRTQYSLNSPQNCYFEYEQGRKLFFDASICTVDANSVGAELYCYQTGSDGFTVFGS